MKLTFSYLLTILLSIYQVAFGQLLHDRKDMVFARADSLRGGLTHLRTCYDVTYYHLDVKVDTLTKSIEGSNRIAFRVVEPFDKMQVDLFENMKIDKIMFDDGTPLQHEREHNAVFITVPGMLEPNTHHEIMIHYSGKPMVAKRPPWEGGFVWANDKEGNPWIAVTCQGTGASLWWPNKDHQSDEPDSMTIGVTVPEGLMNISNGRLRSKTSLPNGWTRYDWFVSYPINNYNVTLNIGKFVHFRDFYIDGDTLTLDYYVMPDNLEMARKQFEQVGPMLGCFEKYFGRYPFPRDGFKLVESPHLGMEHQSAIAYGNRYVQGYKGTASSEVGLTFDFVIIHETAHEWWGNSVTSEDIADMWIHESFGAYAEALYVECLHGYDKALSYINGKKTKILNRKPIIGVYGVNQEGSRDMYNKGQLVLNTLRHVINDDKLWWEIIFGLANEFKHQILTADDIVNYVNDIAGEDYTYFFDQYLKYPRLPELEVKLTVNEGNATLDYKWDADVQDFRMPIKVTTSREEYEFIRPTTSSQSIELDGIKPEEFGIAEHLFYVDIQQEVVYVDPSKDEQW
jgi:aminopeptidase N